MSRRQVRNLVGEKRNGALGGVVHVKSSWRGEEVYVASGNHFNVAHGLRKCVYMCRLAVFISAAGLWGPVGCACVPEVVPVCVFTYVGIRVCTVHACWEE